MKKLSLFGFMVLILALAGMAQKSAHYGAPKFAPTDGKKLLILGQDLGSVGGLATHSNGYIDSISQHFPSGVTSYTDIPNLGGLKTQTNWGAGDINAQAYVNDTSFDNTFIVIGLYLVNRLQSIKNGSYDAKIREFALWCKDQPRPIFIRIGYEFEGPWNNYGQNDFKEAWKHIVHIFDQEEVQNVAYVWQSAGLNRTDIEKWYPGDYYVNWVGYSYFDGNNMGQSIRNFADEHDKPVMIAEATPRRLITTGAPEGHWNSWFQPLFNTIYGNDRIKALAYINANWNAQSMWTGQGWGDSRVQEVPYIKNLWLGEIGKPEWLTASNSLFDSLNYQMWIDSIAVASIAEPIPADQIAIQKDTQTIRITSLDHEPLEKVMILDIQGRVIFQQENRANHYQIPTSQLASGVIVILVEKDGKLFRQKEMIW